MEVMNLMASPLGTWSYADSLFFEADERPGPSTRTLGKMRVILVLLTVSTLG